MEPAEPTTSKKQSQKEQVKNKDLEKSTAIIDQRLPGSVFCQKWHSRPGAGGIFAKSKRGKKGAQNSIYSRNGAAKGAPGGSLGGPWVPWGGPLGDPWGSLKRLPGAQGDPWTPISANRRPSKIIGFTL